VTVDVKRLRELLKHGSPRPWYVVEQPWVPPDAMPYVVSGDADPHAGEFVCDVGIVEEWDDENTYERQAHQKSADAELIAAAVNALPAVLDRLAAAEDALTTWLAGGVNERFRRKVDAWRSAKESGLGPTSR
jgi:hypothetical protein